MGNTEHAYFKVGQPLDAVVYDAISPLIAASSLETVLPTILYSSDSAHCKGTIVNGEWIDISGKGGPPSPRR